MELLAATFVAFSFSQIQGWIQTGGYFVLFGLLFACGLGLPLPEDVPLIIGGALVAKGQMNLMIVSIAAWCGIIGGDCVLYHIAKKAGSEINRVPLIGKHVTRERIERVERMFEQYGVWVVAVGRLFAGIRGAMVIAAGATRFNFVKFVVADGLAALVSGGFFVAVGYWLGNNLTEQRIREFKEWFFVGGIVLAVGLIIWFVWKKRHATEVVEMEAKVVERVAQAAEKLPHPHPKKEMQNAE